MKKLSKWYVGLLTIGFIIEVWAISYIALWLYGFQKVMM
jgi:hypothetical protein